MQKVSANLQLASCIWEKTWKKQGKYQISSDDCTVLGLGGVR